MALSLQRYTWSYVRDSLNGVLRERSEKEREKSTVIAIKIGDILSEDVIIEILSWLPVKTLLQFKSVCKSWYAIITSSKFISKHLENYYSNSDSDCLLTQCYVSHAELQVYEELIDETVPRVLSYESLDFRPVERSYICGPCDGIYYLWNYDDRALWNPAINELRFLPALITKPDLPSNFSYFWFDNYGFGLDPVTKDYKVIVIKGYRTDGEGCKDIRYPLSVLVYSLGTHSWRYCGDLTQYYYLENNRCYIFVNGVTYWLGSCAEDENSEVIISFDVASDEFQEIRVPDCGKAAFKNLAVYSDSVAMFTVHKMEKVLDIWTMNEGCWAKQITMGPFPKVPRPVGHWKKNILLLEFGDYEQVLCDPTRREIRDLAFRGERWSEGVYAYTESLVSIEDKNVCGQREEAETDVDQV